MNTSTEENFILVVDDDEGMSALVGKHLERQGYRTDCLKTGQATLSWFTSHQADLILLDYRLPDMTAEELVKAMRERNIMAPFIMITGHGGEKVSVEMMKLGAEDYLIKDSSLLNSLPQIVNQAIAKTNQESKSCRVKSGRREQTLFRRDRPLHCWQIS